MRPESIQRVATGKKALVTGAAGFIGSHVARECVELGLDVVAVDDMSGGFARNVPPGVRLIIGDLKNATFVSELFVQERFDVVYHLAAYAAEGLSHFIRNYNYGNNLIASTNIVTQSVRVGTVKRIVFTSSIAVYGSGRTPMTEDMNPLPEDPYGIAKFAVELDLKSAHELWGIEYVIFRPHNVYGPGQNMYDRYRNVIGIFMNQLQAGKPLTVFGDGDQTRKFSYISDVSYPIALSGVLTHVAQEIFNVGGDIASTVNELAEVTKHAWGESSTEVLHLDARNEVTHAESDHQKLNCFFPGLPKPVGLRDGIQRMVQWAQTDGKYFPPVTFGAVEVKLNMPTSWITSKMREVPAFHHSSEDNPFARQKQVSAVENTSGKATLSERSFTCEGEIQVESLPRELHDLGLKLFSSEAHLRDVLRSARAPERMSISGLNMCIVASSSDDTIQRLRAEFQDGDFYGTKSLSDAKRGILVDVGANIGVFSISAALQLPSARVLAFEPTPITYFFFRMNLMLNNIVILKDDTWLNASKPGVFAVHGAAGSADGVAEVKFNPKISQNAAIGTHEPMTITEKWESAPVNVYAIPRLIGDDTVQIFKIDCEGCEFAVIPAAEHLLLNKTKVHSLRGELHLSLMNEREDTYASKPSKSSAEATKRILTERGCAVSWHILC